MKPQLFLHIAFSRMDQDLSNSSDLAESFKISLPQPGGSCLARGEGIRLSLNDNQAQGICF